MNGSILLILLILPLVGALVVTGMKGAPAATTKWVAFAFSIVELIFAIVLWAGSHDDIAGSAGSGANSGYFATVHTTWISSFGISFSLGVDGISLVMIALIAVLVPIVLGASWEEKLPAGRTIGGYFALILTLQCAMVGVFAATDVFLFYVFFEVMLIPMYFLIGYFGGPRRTFAATKFFLYSLVGGLLMLAALIGLYVASGHQLGGSGTFDWATLRSIADKIPRATQDWIFAGFAIAFAIKAPLVPLHTWLPDAGEEAPAGTGALLVGVLDKVGTFGFLRICLPLLPAASHDLAWLMLLLALLGILYGAIVAARQTDLKRFVTFTSIAHFGFIVMGIFAFTTQSMTGAALYMVNHGLATGLLFLIIGMLVARGGSQLVRDYGGVWKVAPLLGGVFLFASMATVALPGTNSFVSEFLVLIGLFDRSPGWAAPATFGMVLAAIYMLWIFQRTMTGPVRGAAVLAPTEADPGDGEPAGELVGAGVGPGGGDEPVAAAPVLRGKRAAAAAQSPQPGSVATASIEGAVETTAVEHVSRGPKPVKVRFGDLRPREIAVVTPLIVLILFLGIYPKPVIDVLTPTVAATQTAAHATDPGTTSNEGGQ